MAPKRKAKHNLKFGKKVAPSAEKTADEYLEDGVEFEEAGEKWRGGDIVKSLRAFHRALDCYTEGLKKYPKSFDLAFNKARLQYELTQHPKLKQHLTGALLGHLEVALGSSRYALQLDNENADHLFNMGQILTSIAEAVSEDRLNTLDPLPFLVEAVELFGRCLELQVRKYETQIQQTQRLQQADTSTNTVEMADQQVADPADTEDGGVSLHQNPPSGAIQEEEWVTIDEPVTIDTLIDTVIANLQCLTLFCSLLPSEPSKYHAGIEEYTLRLMPILDLQSFNLRGVPEVGLAYANFTVSYKDASFRSQTIDIGDYFRSLNEVYSPLDLKDNAVGLVNRAEALITYNSSVKLVHGRDYLGDKEILASRWKALTAALDDLAAATKIDSAENLHMIHMTRGDAELLRYQLGHEGYELAKKSWPVLAKNAETFYRGAGRIARASGAAKEGFEADVKEALAQAMKGDGQKLLTLMENELGAQEVLNEAMDEGIIGEGELDLGALRTLPA